MEIDAIVDLINLTFGYYEAVGRTDDDQVGLDAVREVRDRMLRDLKGFDQGPSKTELGELSREWRTLRIEPTGPPEYPPDLFIEDVVDVIEASSGRRGREEKSDKKTPKRKDGHS